MNDINFLPKDKGAFVLEENSERVAEMIVGIADQEISVYHTGVVERLERQGIGTRLIDAMAEYARENKLMVIPFCPFVKAQFKSKPEKYADVWKQDEP